MISKWKAETTGDAREAAEQVVAEIEGDQSNLLRGLKVLGFLFNVWNPAVDTPEGFIEDLRRLSLLPKDKENEAIDLVDYRQAFG